MIYGKVVGAAAYQVIDMGKLPEEVTDNLECPGNDCAKIYNPKYHQKFKQWLIENGHDPEACYIGWWSW